MDNIVISGVRPYDGRYEFDIENQPLSTREWGWIKRLAGYLPAQVEAETFGDPELIVVLAAIALRRSDKIDDRDVPDAFARMSDAPFPSAVKYEPGPVEEETEPGPPQSSSNSNDNSSGADSKKSSETSEPTQTASGAPDSATSEFEHLRSVS